MIFSSKNSAVVGGRGMNSWRISKLGREVKGICEAIRGEWRGWRWRGINKSFLAKF